MNAHSSEIHLPYGSVTEAGLLSVVRAISSKDIMEVDEFTATIDQRELPATVGFFFEISGPLGMRATSLCFDV